MSKVYVFFTFRIAGVAGSQRYLAGKSKWLSDCGYDVAVICEQGGDIQVSLPSKIQVVVEPLLACRPSMLGRIKRNRLIEKVKKAVSGFDTVEIESLTLDIALWAEIVAAEVNAKHMIFCLDEKLYSNYSSGERAFFKEKYRTNGLYFINASILSQLVGAKKDYHNHILAAYQDNPIEDIPFSFGDLSPVDIRIGTITRLEKTYVADFLTVVCRLCERHPEKTFALTIVGDAESSSVKSHLAHINSIVPNLVIEILGYMSVIPLGLIKSFDIAICKARSSYLCASNGIPTFHYALYKDVCVGLFGIDFHNAREEQLAAPVNLLTSIENVLFRNGFRVGSYRYDVPHTNYTEHMSRMKVCKSVSKDITDSVLKAKPTIRKACFSLFVRLFGGRPTMNKRWRELAKKSS